jgi:hypothetical protein
VQKKAKMSKEIKHSSYKDRENMFTEWFQQKHKDKILVDVTILREKH